MLIPRVPSPSSPGKGLYNPKAFVTHAASLDQACAHCPRFPTAASRRSLGRVSVPVWPIVLSDRLPIAGTVGRYPAVYLIGRGPIPGRGRNPSPSRGVPGISRGFPRLSRAPGQVPTRYSPVRRCPPKGTARLACVKRAASVRSEPGSNSQLQPCRPRPEDPGPAGTLACFETARPTDGRPPTPAATGRARHGRPRRPAGSRPFGTKPSRADTRRPSVPSPILDDVKERRRTRSQPRAPLGTPGQSRCSPKPPSPDRRRRTPI